MGISMGQPEKGTAAERVYVCLKGVHTQQLIFPLTLAPRHRKCRFNHSLSPGKDPRHGKSEDTCPAPRSQAVEGDAGFLSVWV